MSLNPSIYVASIAAYNAGKLHGVWIDAAQDAEDIKAEIAEMMAKCPEHGEEWSWAMRKDSGRPSEGWLQAHPLLEQRHGVDDRVVNEVCDNCGSPLVVVRSRAGRFCTSECAEAFELS